MRLLNWLLHLAVVALLFFAANLHAQTEGLLPTFIESVAPGTDCGVADCKIMPEGVNTGDLIVVGAVQPDAPTGGGACASNINPPWIVTDTRGNTYTAQTASVTPGGGAGSDDIQMFSTISGSSGANSVSINWGTTGSCGGQLYIARFFCPSCTTDGIATAFGGPGATPVTATTSNTTTANGDLLVSFAALNSGPQGIMIVGPALQYLSSRTQALPEVGAILGFANGGVAGAQSLSTVRVGGNSSGSSVMQTLAFKPSGITIVDTALPHGALTNAYKATIHSVGGAGAITCSITAGTLQTGLSLSGTGSCDITGTPSAANTQSITFQVTDGTNTTTKTLSLTVDASFNTPLVVSHTNGNFDNGGKAVSVSVNCGDVIALQLAVGADTHGSTAWLQTQNGTNIYYRDGFGSPVTPIPGVGGILSGGLLTYLIGPVTQSGLDVVSGINNTGTSSALSFNITVLRGVQAIADYGAFNNTTSTSGSVSLTTSFTAPVSNEVVQSSTVDDNVSATIALAAPFSSVATGNDGFNQFNFGLATGVAAGSISNAATITTSINNTQSTQMFGLRPGATLAACPALVVNGEKQRRYSF